VRQYSITRSTMEWNRIMNALSPSARLGSHVDKTCEDLRADIAQMLAHDSNRSIGPKRWAR